MDDADVLICHLNKRMKRKNGLPDLENLEHAIERIYECALETERLGDVLGYLDGVLDSDGCHFFGVDRRQRRFLANLVTIPKYESAIAAYAQQYSAMDPRRALSDGAPVGKVLACSHYFDSRYVSRSQFYQEFLLPNGARYVMGARLYDDGERAFYVAFNHLHGRSEFEQSHIDALQALTPHLNRTLHLQFQTQALRTALGGALSGLDAVQQAILVLGPNNRILLDNEAAERLIRRVGRLLVSGQKLHVGASPALAAAVERARTLRQPSSVVLGAGADQPCARLYLSVYPIPAEQGAGTPLYHQLDQPDLLVVVDSALDRALPSPQQLMQMFALSRAEARLAFALAQGLSLEEFALQQAISINTVRTQLRAVLSKTGQGRQQDLIRMLMLIPPVAGRRPP